MRNLGNVKMLAIIATALLVGCDAQSRITGYVYDSNERPLADALVQFELVDSGHPEIYKREMRTDASGRFVLWVPHGPLNVSLRLSVNKEGYAPFVKELTSYEARKMRDENYEQKVNLQHLGPG